MKKLMFALLASCSLLGCSDSEVGDVSLGLFTLKDIKLDSMVDPVVTGVTCHVASVEDNLSFSILAIALFLVVKRAK